MKDNSLRGRKCMRLILSCHCKVKTRRHSPGSTEGGRVNSLVCTRLSPTFKLKVLLGKSTVSQDLVQSPFSKVLVIVNTSSLFTVKCLVTLTEPPTFTTAGLSASPSANITGEVFGQTNQIPIKTQIAVATYTNHVVTLFTAFHLSLTLRNKQQTRRLQR